MIQHVILICVAASIGVVGCGGSDGGGGGGEAGEGGTRDAPGTGGGAGDGAGGGGGDGDGGEGGAGGEVEPVFTSVVDRIDAGLVYRLEGCQCQDPDEAISESACLAVVNFTELPLSDQQSTCIDEVTVGEEERTLENRFACLIEVDLAAASCLAMVSECSESAIADCTAARITAAGSCPTPQDSVRQSFFECQATVVEDAVDAFLDYRSAQCDCLTNCTSADPDPDVLECMLDTLQAEVDMLGPQGSTELKCINEFWRRKAVCFGNEMTCDGEVPACLDLPSMLCGISGTILIDSCLTPP